MNAEKTPPNRLVPFFLYKIPKTFIWRSNGFVKMASRKRLFAVNCLKCFQSEDGMAMWEWRIGVLNGNAIEVQYKKLERSENDTTLFEDF